MRRTSRSADQTAARHRDGVRLVDELAAPYPSWAPVDKGRHGVHGGVQVQRSDAEREAAADERDDRHRQLHAELQMQLAALRRRQWRALLPAGGLHAAPCEDIPHTDTLRCKLIVCVCPYAPVPGISNVLAPNTSIKNVLLIPYFHY